MMSPPGSYEDLVTFVEVARHLSFVEAARRTRTPPSTVSRSVARLEEALGVRLLQRTSRRVVLTDEGRQLLLRAAPPVDEIGEALHGIADRGAELRGLVRVTAPAFTGATRVARALASFAKAHPGVTVELDASNVIRDLVEDRFDLALRVGPLDDVELVGRRVWESSFGLFAARSLLDGALRGRRTMSREVLESLPAVVTRPSARWRFRRRDGLVTEVVPGARFAVNDPRAAVDVARQGVGVVLAPREAVPAKDPDLVAVSTELGEPEPAQIFAVYPNRRLLPLRVKMALEWLARDGGVARAPGH